MQTDMLQQQRHPPTTEDMPSYRKWMGLPEVPPSCSAMDAVYSQLYGDNNYDRPWDEAESRSITPQQLQQEMYDLYNKFTKK